MATAAQQLRAATEEAARAASKALGEGPKALERRLAALQRYRALPLEGSALFTTHTERLRGAEALEPAAAPPRLEGPQGEGIAFAPLGGKVQLPDLDPLPGFTQDQLSNLPLALHRSGAMLHLAARAQPNGPFTIRYAPGAGAAFARNVLVLEEGARATVVEEVAGGAQGLLGTTTEVHLGEGAELTLVGIERSGPQHLAVASREARLGPGAALEMHHAFTGGALVKARSDVALSGRGSRVAQTEVVFGAGAQRFDLTSNITHAAPDTTSDALSKAVLRGQARANVKGVITITQEAKGSDSYLGQHAMLLSKQARCIAIPSLEIVNRDIRRAKHAATVAQVDEQQVFYLQTRGLPEDAARKTIVMGFLGPLLQRLGEAAAERVLTDIEAKWA